MAVSGWRCLALMGGGLLLATAPAQAVVPRTGRRVVADELTAMPAAGLAKPLRVQRELRMAQRPTQAWNRLASALGGRWHAAWDAATGVPNRIWGSGIPAPGANASPAIAELFARKLLVDHVDLLAPGASAGDFRLVSNHDDGDLRSVGFAQYADGRRVVGGQISFRFKRDRMFMIGSEALPHVAFVKTTARLAPHVLNVRAADNLRSELALPAASVTAASTEEVVLPLVGTDAVFGYRVATTMTIDGGADGKYLAYVEPATGAVLAVHQQNLYANGTLLYSSVDRHPMRARADRPAPHAHITIGGAPQTTTATGGVTWSPDVAQTLGTAVVGNFVTVVNKAVGGALATTELTVVPGGGAVWNAEGDEHTDAQIQTYLATNRVKVYVREKIDGNMPKLDEAITANVNIAQSCNAFFDGKTINFFHASQQCQNTGMLEDVVFHEFGHALHVAEIIEGVGGFDGAMSEGAADFLAASVTNDAAMGRGFFYDDDPLRHLDPEDREYVWPTDIQEIHHTGLIYGGTFWDLRRDLIATLGLSQGEEIVNRLYLATLRRSTGIPSSLFEALAADDDDGNLDNGTPNECFIRTSYGRHGLRTATGRIAAPATLDVYAAATIVRVDLSGLSERCSGDEIDHVELHHRPAGGPVGTVSKLMTKASEVQYWTQMPLPKDGTLQYSAKILFKDRSVLTLADNLGDPFYQVYQGKTVPLYCTDFEDDPFTQGWTAGATVGESQWAWGVPMGGATDPPAAHSGSHILGQRLGGNYHNKSLTWVEMPAIHVGQWSDVRLQYRRWLAVEDSHYDKARITVDGKQAWINFTADKGDSSSIHHIDREWRFHDVPLSEHVFGHTVRVGFDLETDEGLELGGWHMDDVCIVANVKSVCGDGVKTVNEQCDDGSANANRPGACRTFCRLPTCGDGILDASEECDEGFEGTPACSPACQQLQLDYTGGCCESGRSGGGAIGLGALVGVLLVRRRRRARARA